MHSLLRKIHDVGRRAGRGLFFSVFLFHGYDDVGGFVASFRQNHRPLIEINFAALYGGGGQFQVLHPILEMNRLNLDRPSSLCESHETEAGRPVQWGSGVLDFPFERRLSSESPAKRRALERYLTEGVAPPEDFITTPPFVDSLGWSYAYFLANLTVPYDQKNWVEHHLAFFKVSELREILDRFRIDNPVFRTISRLRESEVEDIVRGSPLVLTDDFLLVKNESRLGFSPLSYWVYDSRDLRAALKDSPYDLISYSPNAICLQRIGNLCWTYSSRHALSYLHRYSLTIAALASLLVVLVGAWGVWRWIVKRQEQKRSRLALQVLSHEFRTPVSSMLLLLDELSDRRTQLGARDQDLVTRLGAEAFRLQRIIEISKNYLQVEGRRIRLNDVEIPSLNLWFQDFCQEWRDNGRDIECLLLDVDQGITTDPFWLKFVLSNLVQNAFAHGRAPVRLRLSRSQGIVRVAVEDQGECDFHSLREMTDPFVKSSRSQGMGLGLNLVKLILAELGGRLEFSRAPTSFTLYLELS